MRDMQIQDMNIRENEYVGQTYAKSNVYTIKLIKFKLTFEKTKMLSSKLVYSFTVHFSTVR